MAEIKLEGIVWRHGGYRELVDSWPVPVDIYDEEYVRLYADIGASQVYRYKKITSVRVVFSFEVDDGNTMRVALYFAGNRFSRVDYTDTIINIDETLTVDDILKEVQIRLYERTDNYPTFILSEPSIFVTLGEGEIVPTTTKVNDWFFSGNPIEFPYATVAPSVTLNSEYLPIPYGIGSVSFKATITGADTNTTIRLVTGSNVVFEQPLNSPADTLDLVVPFNLEERASVTSYINISALTYPGNAVTVNDLAIEYIPMGMDPTDPYPAIEWVNNNTGTAIATWPFLSNPPVAGITATVIMPAGISTVSVSLNVNVGWANSGSVLQIQIDGVGLASQVLNSADNVFTLTGEVNHIGGEAELKIFALVKSGADWYYYLEEPTIALEGGTPDPEPEPAVPPYWRHGATRVSYWPFTFTSVANEIVPEVQFIREGTYRVQFTATAPVPGKTLRVNWEWVGQYNIALEEGENVIDFEAVFSGEEYIAIIINEGVGDNGGVSITHPIITKVAPEPDPDPDPDPDPQPEYVDPVKPPVIYKRGDNFNIQQTDAPYKVFATHYERPLRRYIVTPRDIDDPVYVTDLNFYEEPLYSFVDYYAVSDLDVLEIFWLRKRVLFIGVQITVYEPADMVIQPVTNSGILFSPLDCSVPGEYLLAVDGGRVADDSNLLLHSVIIEEPDYLGLQIIENVENLEFLGMRVQLMVADEFDWRSRNNRTDR